MESDIFTNFLETLSKHMNANEICKFNSYPVKTSNRPQEADFIISFNNKVDEDSLNSLKNISNELELPVQDIQIQSNRILVSLDRLGTFTKCLQLINSTLDNFGRSLQFSEKKICFTCDDESSSEDFTNYRVNLLSEIARNLASAVGFTVLENNSASSTICHFTHKSNISKNIKHSRTILCGVVQNSDTKSKETNLSVSEYKSMKNEILIEEMKDRDKLLENVSVLLTDAVLKCNLLHVKVNVPVVINFHPMLGNFDGTAVFIMYNYSRLNAIIHEYEERVRKKYYPPLPPIDSVDLSVLSEEKEWIILSNFLLQFPSVVLSTVKDIEKGNFAPHLLFNFLHRMSRTVSSYYRTTKILLYNRSQLIPLIVARIYLIKGIRQVFSNGLNLLNIKPAPAV